MTGELVCWRCGTVLKDVPRRIPRMAECVECRADLHVCLMCRHYAPRYIGQCTHDRAERVIDKEKSNFCTYFRPRPDAHLPPDTGTEESTRAALGELFRDSDAEGEESPTEQADNGLTDLFGLESTSDAASEEDKARQQLNALFGDPEPDDNPMGGESPDEDDADRPD